VEDHRWATEEDEEEAQRADHEIHTTNEKKRDGEHREEASPEENDR
jgi:hypothetical protein